ncbi:MAG: type II toxin-antitoxin system HigB family toxin [Calothrix sp. FI2-JRJ7]|jgi:mRNA interferase HigB|nr:type II toxin-antitoxin system HigB family toxin [Calothrix sp. FI2-JRJ7]
MHVISRKKLREFSEIHGDCDELLKDWYKVSSDASWGNLVEVQDAYPQAEAVGSFTVFNIKGNKYRLIVSIDYKRQIIYVKYILTYAEYDKDNWKNNPYY